MFACDQPWPSVLQDRQQRQSGRVGIVVDGSMSKMESVDERGDVECDRGPDGRIVERAGGACEKVRGPLSEMVPG